MEADTYFEDFENQLKIFEQTVKQQEKALESALEYIVRSIANYAKRHGPWTDRTSNLRNSIGCNIEKAEEIPAGKDVSRRKARELAKPVIEVEGDDYTAVVSAGMEYAIWVELRDGYWVLQGAIDKFEPLIMKYFADHISVEKLSSQALFDRFVEGEL